MGRLRRTTELGLLVLGALIIVAAYVLASLGRTASMPADIGPFLGVVLGLFLAAHIAVRRLAPDADGLLLPLAGLLNGLGYVFIARMDTHLAGLQATWTAVGIGAFVGTLLIVRAPRSLEPYRYTFAAVGIGLLCCPRRRSSAGRSTVPASGSAWARSTSSLVRPPSWPWPPSWRPTWWRSGSCWR